MLHQGYGRPDFCEIRITLIAEVKDVVSGEMMPLHIPGPNVHPTLRDDLYIRILYDTIRRFEMHELDEHFYMDGVKIYDPHKHDPKITMTGKLTPDGVKLAESLFAAVV